MSDGYALSVYRTASRGETLKIVAVKKYHLETRAIVDDYIARAEEHAAGHEFVVCEDLDTVRREIADADVMVGWRITPDLLSRAEKLRWIQFGSAGIDHTIFPELIASGVILTTLSGIHTVPVSEHVIALMLGLTRRLDIAAKHQSTHTWDRREMAMTSGELSGRTVGIVGLGKIGLGIAALARSFGMRVVGTKRTVEGPLPNVDELYPASQLDNILPISDFLVLVVPLTGDTRTMIAKREIDMLPDGACLINVARGAMVDHNALGDALRSGKLAGAGLDVFPDEPLPSDSPIYDFPNTILTPHTAGSSPRYSERGAAIFAHNLDAFVSGGEMINLYDREKGY